MTVSGRVRFDVVTPYFRRFDALHLLRRGAILYGSPCIASATEGAMNA
jgi:hypothetical protein